MESESNRSSNELPKIREKFTGNKQTRIEFRYPSSLVIPIGIHYDDNKLSMPKRNYFAKDCVEPCRLCMRVTLPRLYYFSVLSVRVCVCASAFMVQHPTCEQSSATFRILCNPNGELSRWHLCILRIACEPTRNIPLRTNKN